MQFVKTQIGLVNLAFVQRIDRNAKGKAILYFADGTAAVTEEDYEEFEMNIGPIVPDHSDTQHMQMGVDCGEVYHSLEPVIGWQINRFGARPIYAEPDEGFLVYSNGAVECNERQFGSVTEALADFAAKNGAILPTG